MIRYECDKCGTKLMANDPNRFIVRLEVYAAAGHVDLDDASETDVRSQLESTLDQLRRADPDDMEDKTYRSLRFDICDACRREVLRNPLG